MRDDTLPEQMASMCRLTYLPAAATVPGAMVVTFALGPSLSVSARLLWVGGLAGVSLARAVACHAYLGRARSLEEARRWLWLLLGLTAIAGFIWSFGGSLLLPVNQPNREALAAECLMAVLAISFISLSSVPGAFATFATALIVPTAAWHIYLGYWPRPLLGGLYFIFLGVMVAGASRQARTAGDQFRLLRENRLLTDRLRQERDAVLRINDQLRVASETKSRFLSHVSHELRTPLTVILGYSDLLLRDERERRRPESLEHIRSAGKLLLGIVNDLLDLSSIEAGQLKVEESEFSPQDVLSEIAGELRGHPEARDLEIAYHVAPDLPLRVRSDRARLHQVLLNLGVNALRFTPHGRVALSLRRASSEDATLRVRGEVADTGIGIPADAQARLFQPFSQLDDPTTRRVGGAGLGLAICRAIIERLGGTIGVQSMPGSGSTFWFELPLQAAEAVPADPQHPVHAASALAGTVLVAEDHAATRALLVRVLREAGCAPITEVASGSALVNAARTGRYDLMLIDWHLPELDGLEAIRLIRATESTENRARTPIVVATASAMAAERAHCLEAGADAVVDKPLDLERLTAVLGQWLRTASGSYLPMTSGASAGTSSSRAKRRSVLIAEDHAVNRNLIARLLESAGYVRVEAVGNGRDAVAAFEREPFDLLLVDWKMPVLDGLEALIQIRAVEQRLGRPRAAIVMMSGRVEESEIAACMAAGADGYLPKPYTVEELPEAAERALRAVGR